MRRNAFIDSCCPFFHYDTDIYKESETTAFDWFSLTVGYGLVSEVGTGSWHKYFYLLPECVM